MTRLQRHRPVVRRAAKDHWMIVINRRKIKQARDMKGWSQAGLAGLCNRSQNAIHLLESGKTKYIVEEFAIALCKELGLNPEEIFGEMPDGFVPTFNTDSGNSAKQVSV